MNRPAHRQPDAQPDDPAYFLVDAYGSGVPGLMVYAQDQAQRVYGPAARLHVVRIGALFSSASPQSPGPVRARVLVHCLNYDEALDGFRDRLAEAGTARLLAELTEFLTEADPAAGDFGGRREEAPRG